MCQLFDSMTGRAQLTLLKIVNVTARASDVINVTIINFIFEPKVDCEGILRYFCYKSAFEDNYQIKNAVFEL